MNAMKASLMFSLASNTSDCYRSIILDSLRFGDSNDGNG